MSTQLADRDVCSEAGIDMQKPQEVSTFDQGNRVKRVGQWHWRTCYLRRIVDDGSGPWEACRLPRTVKQSEAVVTGELREGW